MEVDPSQKPAQSGAGEPGPIVDAFSFARHRGYRSGSIELEDLARAVEDLPDQPEGEAGMVHWSVQGEMDTVGLSYLRLKVTAKPLLECQRCMQLFVYPIDSEVVLQLVHTPDKLEGDATDEDEIDENAPEKVLGTQRFNLLDQVEDEMVLCIPYVPKHESCADVAAIASEHVDAAFEESQSRPSPFAALARLKNE